MTSEKQRIGLKNSPFPVAPQTRPVPDSHRLVVFLLAVWSRLHFPERPGVRLATTQCCQHEEDWYRVSAFRFRGGSKEKAAFTGLPCLDPRVLPATSSFVLSGTHCWLRAGRPGFHAGNESPGVTSENGGAPSPGRHHVRESSPLKAATSNTCLRLVRTLRRAR